jgi:ubiquinone biosynthesis protein UbiJ
LADRPWTSSSTIVLRREEWEAFVEDVSRLLKAYDELLKRLKP